MSVLPRLWKIIKTLLESHLLNFACYIHVRLVPNALLTYYKRVLKALYDTARERSCSGFAFKTEFVTKMLPASVVTVLLLCTLTTKYSQANCARKFVLFFRLPFDWFLIHVTRRFVHKTFDIFPCDFKRSNKVFFSSDMPKFFAWCYQLISIYLLKLFDCPICNKNAISVCVCVCVCPMPGHATPTVHSTMLLFLERNLSRECT